MAAFARLLGLTSLLALSLIGAEAPAADAASPTLETLVVTGAVPGPALWRVEKGSHTLWLMGTVSPLSRDLKWEGLQVEDVLRQADAVLSPAIAEADLSAGDVFKMMTLARSAIAATKLPGRAKLVDVLPTATYERWSAMKQHYLHDDRKVERQRPVFASQELYFGAIESQGLTRTNIVWNFVSERATELDVPIVDAKVRIPLALDRKRYKAGIHALANSQLDDIACFTATLDRLPAELERMRIGANAWATGDLERLLAVEHAALAPPCKAYYDQVMGFQNASDRNLRARTAWLAAADIALAENDTTLGVMPMADLLGPSGVLAEFSARGYHVIAPDAEIESIDP